MSKQTAIRLPYDLHVRLKALAAQTERAVSYDVREAAAQHLDEMESVYQAERKVGEGRRKRSRREEET